MAIPGGRKNYLPSIFRRKSGTSIADYVKSQTIKRLLKADSPQKIPDYTEISRVIRGELDRIVNTLGVEQRAVPQETQYPHLYRHMP